jgi:hypothetical protein
MRLARTKAYVAFDGAVTFHMLTYRAARMGIALDELQRAFPEAFDTRSGAFYKQLLAFIYCYGVTFDIEFNLKADAPDDLADFQEWWTRILPKGDYKAAFHAYLACVPQEIANVWAEAMEATRAPQPTAPAEMQPGAAERAETDPDFTQAASESSANSRQDSVNAPSGTSTVKSP